MDEYSWQQHDIVQILFISFTTFSKFCLKIIVLILQGYTFKYFYAENKTYSIEYVVYRSPASTYFNEPKECNTKECSNEQECR